MIVNEEILPFRGASRDKELGYSGCVWKGHKEPRYKSKTFETGGNPWFSGRLCTSMLGGPVKRVMQVRRNRGILIACRTRPTSSGLSKPLIEYALCGYGYVGLTPPRFPPKFALDSLS